MVPSPQAEWQEGAGSLLLLAATHQTGLLTELQTALSPNLLTADLSLRLAHSQPATLRRLVLTLLFLEAVGLQRTWDLRGYTGQALALLTGRQIAYGYRHTERFLAELAQVGADEALTEALTIWTAMLWKPRPRPAHSRGLRLVGTETRKRKQDKWASHRGRELRSHPFRGLRQVEQNSTFPFLLAFALVLSDLQAQQKTLFCFPCF